MIRCFVKRKILYTVYFYHDVD